MDETLANAMTFLGGVVGATIGFLVLAFILVALFVPLIHYLRSRTPHERSGISRFAASLNKPDVGYRDRIPGEHTN